MTEAELIEVVEFLNELKTDATIPKNIKCQIDSALVSLNSEGEISMKISRTVQNLDSVCEDPNLDSFIRSQILSVVSLLESI
ncbi:UPF0147 family protein [Candidatus Woesearchaeota archaeon]|nr:UPF0147 family protein [Candidatus Woesearchaeota archaeon]